MIELKITAANHKELFVKISDFLSSQETPSLSITQALAPEAKSIEISPTKKVKKKAKKKPSPKIEEVEEVEVEVEVEEVEVEVEVEDSKPEVTTASKITTLEEAYTALQKVSSSISLTAARNVLLGFDCQRISDLQEIDYAAFVGSCGDAVSDHMSGSI